MVEENFSHWKIYDIINLWRRRQHRKQQLNQSLALIESATKHHSMRAHLQVIEWKTLMSVELNPLDWEWKLSNGHYCPIMTDLNAAPDNILRFIRCNCNIFKKNVHAVLILAVAKSMVLSVFLLVGFVTWTTSVTKKKIEIYLIYLMIEKPKTPKNIL